MKTAAYEVIEFQPETGDFAGLFIDSNGSTMEMSVADIINRFDDIQLLGECLMLETAVLH